MGRPFESEMSSLAATYEWAIASDLGPLKDFSKASMYRDLFAVGSGGSFSVATYSAHLHQLRGSHASAVTPLEFSEAPALRSAAVLIYSAGGSNSDILAAYNTALKSEPEAMGIMCLRPRSKLVEGAARHDSVHLWAKASPAGKDGFLATNSLLAFFVLTHRLYRGDAALPRQYSELARLAETNGCAPSVVSKDYLIVLYSPSTKAAAVDFESKFSEAGLASVQLADFRNFAHGRHNWVAKKGDRTGVFAFVAAEANEIAEKTLRQLQGICETAVVRTDVDPSLASLACLPATFEFTRLAGHVRGIDPGRPGVPGFGRRIYNLTAKSAKSIKGASALLETVLRRKLDLMEVDSRADLQRWREAARQSIKKLQEPTYRAIVFDFDNTLCGPKERFGPLRADVTRELERLASFNIRIGVATGRGQSARKQLRASVKEEHWRNFLIAYYNGAEIGELADDTKPAQDNPERWFTELGETILSDGVLKRLCTVTMRKEQITVEPTSCVSTEWLWREVLRCTANSSRPVRVIHSTRSVDVVTAGVTKCALVRRLADQGIPPEYVLCIGDLGQFPGNDFELLRHQFSISCDKPSTDIDGCWNFAPIGYRGVQATVYYLQKLKKVRRGVKLRIPALR